MPNRRIPEAAAWGMAGVARILAVGWVLAGGLGGGVAAAQDDCTTAGCHPTILQGTHVHEAAASCADCHTAASTPHPQKGVATFKLDPPAAELCATCHEDVGKLPHVHAPVAEHDCTSCHEPHASEHAKLLTASPERLCLDCHEDVATHAVVHGPVGSGECLSCHRPHDSEVKSLLAKPVEAVCMDCHEDVAVELTRKDVHGAMDGGCTSCHDPHGSDHPELLKASGKELCFECHSDMKATVDAAPVPHPPAVEEGGCGSCHAPHGSDQAKLLLKPEKETCVDCHDTVVTKAMTNLHGPVADGDCSSCHAPHGGPHPKLLAKEHPEGPYVAYTGAEFELCFSCHERGMVTHAETSFLTEFRDGERNLHHVHVNDPKKARSCKLCHSAHGSAGPKLVPAAVPFGTWSLPLGFVKTETGGSCTPGCHKPLAYDRETPGKKPPVPGRPAGS